MYQLWQDLRYAARMLRKNPGFTAVAVLTLALGNGANTAIFSVVDAALLRPLPYPQASRIIQILHHNHGYDDTPAISVPQFLAWRDRNRVFDHLAAYSMLPSGVNFSGSGEPERIRGIAVTNEFFSVLRVHAALGRTFLPEEDRLGGARVVILSNELWKNRFAADSNIVGRNIQLNGASYSVVGIMPNGFDYPEGVKLWIPMQLPTVSTDPANLYNVLGRLKEGVTVEAAQAQMNVLQRQFLVEHPEIPTNNALACVVLQDRLVGNLRPILLILLGAVGLVLLIACANVANLLLARAASRQQEISVRTALGASPSRLLSQLLTESLLLGFLGSAFGFFLADMCIGWLKNSGPASLPRLPSVTLDQRVLGFCLLVSVVTSIIFGLGPALQASRLSTTETLKEGSRGISGSSRRHRVRGLLVATEISISLVLLIGAVLLIRSAFILDDVKPGFESNGVLTLQMSLPAKYGTPANEVAFYRQVLHRLKEVPGIEAAATVTSLPTELRPDLPVTVEGRVHQNPREPDVESDYLAISADYFRVMQIPLLRGRTFTDADNEYSPGVALINETVARKVWPNEDPIGKQITIGKIMGPDWSDPAPREIVGVIADVKDSGLDKEAPAEVYVPYAQVPPHIVAVNLEQLGSSWVVKTPIDFETIRSNIQRAIQAVDPDQAIANVRTMDQMVAASVAAHQFDTFLLAVFASLALVLASIGTYGVISYGVSERVHEIGVRKALGAQRSDVFRLVIGQGMRFAVLGVGIGLIAAFGLMRLLASLLFGVTATDPATFAGVALLLTMAALAACYIPARRATKIDPMVALRHE